MSFLLVVLGKGLDTVATTMRLLSPNTRYPVFRHIKMENETKKLRSPGFVCSGTLDRVQGIYC